MVLECNRCFYSKYVIFRLFLLKTKVSAFALKKIYHSHCKCLVLEISLSYSFLLYPQFSFPSNTRPIHYLRWNIICIWRWRIRYIQLRSSTSTKTPFRSRGLSQGHIGVIVIRWRFKIVLPFERQILSFVITYFKSRLFFLNCI